jgi:predicted DNA-binding protein (UPF0251 family)
VIIWKDIKEVDMHIEFLVEDVSGERMLEILLPKILSKEDTYTIHSYKGIGHIPRNMKPRTDANKRILLDSLPKLLQGYGKTFRAYGNNYDAIVVVVCDLDDNNQSDFRQSLSAVLAACDPKPKALFCLAIEEMEAWYLGDIKAIKQAYAHAKMNLLNEYINDSICGTWELLADAVYKGGHTTLKKKGWQAIGAEKTKWAQEITPYMDVKVNKSPSFNSFLSELSNLYKG